MLCNHMTKTFVKLIIIKVFHKYFGDCVCHHPSPQGEGPGVRSNSEFHRQSTLTTTPIVTRGLQLTSHHSRLTIPH